MKSDSSTHNCLLDIVTWKSPNPWLNLPKLNDYQLCPIPPCLHPQTWPSLGPPRVSVSAVVPSLFFTSMEPVDKSCWCFYFLNIPQMCPPFLPSPGTPTTVSQSISCMPAGMLSHFSRVWLCATLWTVACQVPLSMEFSRQEYWSGLPCPLSGDLPNPGIEPRSPALQPDSLLSGPPGKPKNIYVCII